MTKYPEPLDVSEEQFDAMWTLFTRTILLGLICGLVIGIFIGRVLL